jgi:hypothetical protein
MDIIQAILSDPATSITVFAAAISVASSYLTAKQRYVGWISLVSLFTVFLSGYTMLQKSAMERSEKLHDRKQADSVIRRQAFDIKNMENQLNAYQEKIEDLTEMVNTSIEDGRFFEGIKDYQVDEVTFSVYSENDQRFRGIESRLFGDLFANHRNAEVILSFHTVQRIVSFRFRRTNDARTCFEQMGPSEDDDTTLAFAPAIRQDIFETNRNELTISYRIVNRKDSSIAPIKAGEVYESMKDAETLVSLEINNLDATDEEISDLFDSIREKFMDVAVSFSLNKAIGSKFYAYLVPVPPTHIIGENAIRIDWEFSDMQFKTNPFAGDDVCFGD